MGRPLRNSQGGYVYHVIGRGIKTKPVFRSEDDYQEFMTTLEESLERFEPRLLAFCILPKHWHLVLTPRKDGDLSKWMGWLTTTHSARWHTKPRRAGTGGLYERRFKSFPIQDDRSLLHVMQFVESHPRRSGLAELAEDWQWSSGWNRKRGADAKPSILASSPIALPENWQTLINQPIEPEILEAICLCIQRGRPFGELPWVEKTVKRLGLESTLRPRGRPKKSQAGTNQRG